jgi:hypothetical protein
MKKIVALMLAVVPACFAPADPGPADPGVGELEGLTTGEAAERLGRAIHTAINDCQKECIAFTTEGRANITSQCEDGTGTDFAFAGAYVTDCATAKRLACGDIVTTNDCCTACEDWLRPALNRR